MLMIRNTSAQYTMNVLEVGLKGSLIDQPRALYPMQVRVLRPTLCSRRTSNLLSFASLMSGTRDVQAAETSDMAQPEPPKTLSTTELPTSYSGV